jgi:ABC-type lipoprotein release transport system permease subunit
MARQRVMNFEMEASALMVLATLARCRAGVVCAVYANRTTGEFISGDAQDAAEAACVETGLESLLIGIEPTDPITYAGVIGVLLLVAAAACLLPARRAAALDPAITLREE